MTEIHIERVHTEPIVLDIGGDIGALIIYTDPDSVGREIELSPKDRRTKRVHNQVHERSFNGMSLFAAVYPDLHAGEYDVWGKEACPTATVTITGGAVATLDWRS
jgi:hypothetical protein